MVPVIKRLSGALKFINHQAAGGVILVTTAVLALILSNSPLAWLYDGFLKTPVTLRVGELAIDKPLLLWINDGLMAIFFFLVGLEIKREVLDGELSSVRSAMLPAIAAVGGMAIPAIVYLMITRGQPGASDGWAIPAATDIAFAVGVLALLGNRIPPALTIFLLALAIIDDLGAIIIIALFYTKNLSLLSLALAGIGIIGLLILNLRGTTKITPYALVGLFIWVCVLKSGIHATLAGVVTALFIPLRATGASTYSPLEKTEHDLHPWVAFGVLPLFAFANAGVSLDGITFAKLLTPIPLGIALGLFIGKQIGVFGFAWLTIKFGLSRMPTDVTFAQLYGVSALAGIGFTMSLFIGTLAFPDPKFAADIRIGVLTGSIMSAAVGYVILLLATEKKPVEQGKIA